jgi:hypothetical protein
MAVGTRRIATRVASVIAGAAVAATVLGAAGAQAAPVKNLPTAGKGGLPVHTVTAAYTAPTANLTKIANALTFKQKSITSQITAPAGLNLTKPVRLFISYADRDIEFRNATYSNSAGNRIVYNFPELAGLATTGGITVHLQEQVSATQVQDFYVSSTPVVEPLYDIRVGPLVFQPGATCNVSGVSVNWRTPSGGVVRDHRTLTAGYSTANYFFSNTYTEVGQHNGLHFPTITWGSTYVAPGVSATNLAFANDGFSYSDTSIKASGQNCYARAYYSLNKTLRTYSAL